MKCFLVCASIADTDREPNFVYCDDIDSAVKEVVRGLAADLEPNSDTVIYMDFAVEVVEGSTKRWARTYTPQEARA